PDKPFHYQFARGWLDLVRVLPVPDAFFPALARSPQARLLRQLEIVYDMAYHPFDFDVLTEGPVAALTEQEEANEISVECDILPPLLQSPYLSNLRSLEIGFGGNEGKVGYSTMVNPFGNCNAAQIIDLLGKCPHMEELYLNTNLPGIHRLFAL